MFTLCTLVMVYIYTFLDVYFITEGKKYELLTCTSDQLNLSCLVWGLGVCILSNILKMNLKHIKVVNNWLMEKFSLKSIKGSWGNNRIHYHEYSKVNCHSVLILRWLLKWHSAGSRWPWWKKKKEVNCYYSPRTLLFSKDGLNAIIV